MAKRQKNRSYRVLRSGLADRLVGNYTLIRTLPAFLRERVTVEQAEEEVKRSLERRETTFLELARRHIFDRPSSPYLKLLGMAGCEFSDLRAHVLRDGIEATLEKLAGEGVYLTSAEFKGKAEVARGKDSLRISPEDLDPPNQSRGLTTQSSGSNNRPFVFSVSLDRWRLSTLSHCLFYSAHDLFSYSHAIYDAILPSGGGVRAILHKARLGVPTERWFARKLPEEDEISGYYHRWMTYLIVALAKRYGPGAPLPEFIDVERLDPIVDWIAEKKRQGGACCLKTAASSAIRIAQTAWRMGESLEGTKFHVGGEPFTQAKHEALRRVGATAVADYAFEGGGSIGIGCANPAHLDEIHVGRHRIAVVARPQPLDTGASTIRPLLCTTLHPWYAKLLFNVENGDYASFEKRDCGCALEKLGLTQHLHHIRSYEKFTSEGMNYFYGDLYEFFEKTLPAEFGGGPGDYQLVEEEDGTGQTRITLLVHPSVPDLDEERLLSRVRAGLGEASWAKEFQVKIWQNAGTFRVRREAPHAGARGKILPLHITRPPRSER